MLRFLISILLLAQGALAFAQDDVEVVLHEDVINKVLAAIGNISDTAEYKVFFYSGTYKWTVIDPKIELEANGQAEFKCDVLVEAGFVHYRSEVVGRADVSYDKQKNLINVKIVHGIFEIYTRVLGSKLHITNIDLAEYYSDPLTFEGPMSLVTAIPFTMPDNSIKTIYAVPEDCTLLVQEHKIVVNCEVGFTDKDPAKK
jgi:hypothetical protein